MKGSSPVQPLLLPLLSGLHSAWRKVGAWWQQWQGLGSGGSPSRPAPTVQHQQLKISQGDPGGREVTMGGNLEGQGEAMGAGGQQRSPEWRGGGRGENSYFSILKAPAGLNV